MGNARLRDRSASALWLALLVPALLIGTYALRYVSGDPALLPWELRVNLLHNPPAFVLHTTFGGLALLLGPWQFLSAIRRRRPAWHRWAGRAYLLCCLVSGLAAYPVAFGTVAGPVATAGFASMATAWLATNALAYRAVRQGRYAQHRRWMVRSYALTLAAVTLRFALLVPLLTDLDFMPVYRLTSWGSWIVNLALAELWLWLSAPARPQVVGSSGLHGAGGGTRAQTSSTRL